METSAITSLIQIGVNFDTPGAAVADLEQQFAVTRRWQRVDASGNKATCTDTMPLPAST